MAEKETGLGGVQADDDEDLIIELDVDEEDEDDSSEAEEQEQKQAASEPEDTDDSDDDEEDDDEELEYVDPEERKKYGKRAQKRIKQLANRNKDLQGQLEELRGEVGRLQDDSQRAKKTTQTLEEQRLTDYEERLNSELAAVRTNYKTAYNSGDDDKLLEAQERIADIKAQLNQISSYKSYMEQQKAGDDSEEDEDKDKSKSKSPPPQKEEKPKPADKRAMKWAKNNSEWFNKDRVMTLAALSIHEDLIQEGYDPQDETDEDLGADAYYKEIDTRIRKYFPEAFGKEERQTSGSRKGPQKMAGAARTPTSKKGKRTVTLTKSEKEMADKLGISYENYAKEKLRLERGRKQQ